MDSTSQPELDALDQNLLDLERLREQGLGRQPVARLLTIAKILSRLAAQVEQSRTALAARLGATAVVLGLGTAWARLDEQLAGLIAAVGGHSEEEILLEAVVPRFRAWSREFQQFEAALQRAEMVHKARVQMGADLAVIRQTLEHPCFRHTRAATLERVNQAEQFLLSSAELEPVEKTLAPLAGAWPADGLRELFARYGSGGSLPPTNGSGSGHLAKLLPGLADWVERSAETLARLAPADLPPSPTGNEPWLTGSIGELALFLETRLALPRAKTEGPIHVLTRLARLCAVVRPDNALAPAEEQVLADLLQLALLDGHLREGLTSIGTLVGTGAGQLVARLLARTLKHEPAWRLPAPAKLSDPAGRDVLRAALAVEDDLPATAWLHLWNASSSEGSSLLASDRADQSRRVQEKLWALGPLGGWILAASLQAAGRTSDVEIEQVCTLPDVPDRAGRLLPLILLPSERRDPGPTALLAALEVLADRRAPGEFGLAAVQAFQARFGKDFPALDERLGRLRSSGVSADPRTALLETARQSLRAGTFRGIRSVETICRRFVHEIAAPLLARAYEADTPAQVAAVHVAIERERDRLDRYLEEQAREFVNPAANATEREGKLGEALGRECDGMLLAIRACLEGDRKPTAARRSGEGIGPELDRLASHGNAGRLAADLLRAALITVDLGPDQRPAPATLALPGDVDALSPLVQWSLPRSATTWLDSGRNLADYRTTIADDLNDPNPLDHALTVANDGRVDQGENILRHFPQTTPEVIRRLAELAEIRASLQDEIQEELRGVASPADGEVTVEAEFMRAGIEQCIHEGAFSIARERLKKYREVLIQAPERQALAERIDTLQLHPSFIGLDRAARINLRNQLAAWLAGLGAASETALRTIDQQLTVLEQRLGVSSAVTPASALVSERPDAVPPTAIPITFGLVKRVLGVNAGFIVPLDLTSTGTVLTGGDDVYFHCDAFEGDAAEVSDLVGRFVAFEVKSAQASAAEPGTGGDRPPPAQSCRRCTAEEERHILRALVGRAGPSPADIGLVIEPRGQRVLVTLGQGPFPVAGGKPCPHGSLARVQFLDDRAVTILGVVEARTLPPLWASFWERLIPATSKVASPVHSGSTAVPAAPSQLRPGTPEALKLAREIHDQVRLTRHPAVAFAALGPLLERTSGETVWWRAVLLYPLLLHARTAADRHALLGNLHECHADWAGVNFDVVAARIYKSLLAFVEDYPDRLELLDVLSFFERVQKDRGDTPHFRAEIILALLQQLLARQEERPERLFLALDHIRKALVLNANQAEAIDLRTRLERETSGLAPREAAIPPTVSSEIPEDPIEAVERIKAFYQREVHGQNTLAAAQKFFERAQPLAAGVVRERLFLEHARCLVQQGSVAEGEQLAVSFLLSDVPPGESRAFLRLLREAWSGLKLSLEQIQGQLERIRQRIGAEEQYYASYLLAQFAFEERQLDLALRFAEESNEASPNAEAQRLIKRVRTLQRPTPAMSAATPTTPGPDATSRRRAEVLAVLKQMGQTGEGRGPIERILDEMAEEEVGPWLVLKAVNGEVFLDGNTPLELTSQDRRDLVNRAQAVAVRPTLHLFQADLVVFWDDHNGAVREDLGGDLDSPLTQVLQSPTTAALDEIANRLEGRPWAAFATFDCLSRQFPDNRDARWRRAQSARQLGRREDYVDSALASAEEKGPASFARVASDLHGLGLHGLSLGLALLAREGGQRLVQLAEQKCKLPPWGWPAALQEAKGHFVQREWTVAANLVIPALLAAPDHWPTCRAFSSIFSRPFEDDAMISGVRERAEIALQLAEAILDHLQKRNPLPELLMVKAELRLHRGRAFRTTTQSEAVDELKELCHAAQKVRAGFQPAIQMEKQLREAEELHLSPGETYHDYRITRHLGKGSFGDVYLAESLEPKPDRPARVALKIIRFDATPEKREHRKKSLLRESNILRQLRHDHVGKVYDFLDERCLVMEYIDGYTLHSKIDAGVRWAWRRVARVGLQVAQALQHAGERLKEIEEEQGSERKASDFAHRDIHPNNIMVRDVANEPHAYVLDFGLARLPGSPQTMSMVRDANRRMWYRDPRYPSGGFQGDMFSLGVILYELASGDTPYPKEEYLDFMDRKTTDAQTEQLLRLVSKLSPGETCPAKFQIILARMVSFRGAKRYPPYPAWSDLIDDFTQLLSGPQS